MIEAQPDPAADPAEKPPLDERQLLPRHCRGERDAFARLVAEYRSPVYSYLGRCGVKPEERDDLFQEIFLRVHRAADRYRPDRPLHPWVFTIVANVVRNHYRRRRVRELVAGKTSPQGPDAPEASDRAPDGERAAQARETTRWLQGRIDRLPAKQRQILILACVEELPLKKVAKALEMPLNTVKTCLRRARLSLTEALADRNRPRPSEVSP